jgi:putative tryptophan/tyrosine transport system substrate-binding protein
MISAAREFSMRRRDFVGLVGGAAAWPLAARAQQKGPARHIGVLLVGERDDEMQDRIKALEAGLRELGWIDGGNLNIDYRWSPASGVRTQAAELVAVKPELILAFTTPALAAAKQATGTIPIVFNSVTDPVAQGFVASLARPGGNITGLGHWEPGMGGKWLELLKETAPHLKHVAVVFNPVTAPYFRLFLPTMEVAARSLAVMLTLSPVHEAAEIERAIATVAVQPDGGLLMLPDAFTWTYRMQIIALAARNRVPAVYQYGHFAREGGLVSYGIDPEDVYRRTATYVDRILKGTKPADLPVQLPTKFELVVNLKTAKALGLVIPESLLARADELIK